MDHFIATRTTILAAALMACIALPAHVQAIDNAECLACHNDKELVKETKDGQRLSMFVDEEKFTVSIHGKLQCTGCHADIKEVPHEDRLKPVSCSQCHRIETDIYLKSDHGMALSKGITEAATCQACHGKPHELLNYRHAESPVNRNNIPHTCAKCHGNKEEMEKYNLRQRAVIVTYDKSVHGIAHSNGNSQAAVCSDCHGTHDLHRGSNPESKLNWQHIPETCGKCHENVKQTYNRSVHGQAIKNGNPDAPTCIDCHGEHTITAIKESSSKVSAAHIPETCGQCHGATRIATRYEIASNVVDTYMKSYHGLAMQFGGVAAASCASCHGFHDILPPEDPMSSVNKANLPQTCGKCHPAIGTRLAQGEIRIHEPPGAAEGKPWVVNFIAKFYLVIIALTIGGMLIHNGLDYFRKARNHVAAVKAANGGEIRLTRIARFQHLSMIILFVILAYTGFVHKFPDAIWSEPFNIFENGSYVRGLVHRVAGWAFVMLVLLHLLALVGSRRGRDYLKVLWVQRHDLTDMLMLMRYNLGLGGSRPPPRKFNYIEKSEYWALIWGSVVMIITGVMLVFTETVLRLWPKVWHDAAMVIHYYEAVLATLAIIVWHFYWVIFDPSEYPMNPAWLIGKKAPHGEGHSSPSPSHSEDAAEKPQLPNNTGSPGKEAPPHDGS